MIGWSKGTLTIEAKFYVDGTLSGTRDNECAGSTSCEVANTTQSYTTAKGWSVTVTGCGSGGCKTESKSA
jgi:hypothetical protein